MLYDKLLYLYQEELSFIQKIAEQYAVSHPKLAGRLHPDLSPKDPHLDRIVDAFALSSARMRYNFEKEFSLTCNCLLQTIHPDFFAAIPSMAIIQFQPNAANFLEKIIPKNTHLVAGNGTQYQCDFKTSYPVRLLPLLIQEARLMADQIEIPSMEHCKASLKLVLAPMYEEISLHTINLESVRFFIQAKAPYSYMLYNLLFQNLIAIGLGVGENVPVLIDKAHIRAVGFGREEAMSSYTENMFIDYSLLQDFFAIPEKFLFFDIVDISEQLQANQILLNKRLEIHFYFNNTNLMLEKRLDTHCFALNCTPVVNLFETYSEPFLLDHTKAEYLLVAHNAHLLGAPEVHAVKRIFSIDKNEKQVEYDPFYKKSNAIGRRYYCLTPKLSDTPAVRIENFLSFVNSVEEEVVYAEIYCSNGDLPTQLSLIDNLGLKIVSPNFEFIKDATVLTSLTPCRRRPIENDGFWRIVSHLVLNHASLIGLEDDIEPLKHVLKLYAFTESTGCKNMIDGLLAMHSKPSYQQKPSTAHIGSVFWNGIEIILIIDETKFSETSIYLFGHVLHQFFLLRSAFNTFVHLHIENRQGEIFYAECLANNLL